MPIRGISPFAPEGLVHASSELRVGEYVIYPGQGVHRVAAFERMDVAGQQLDVLTLEREHDGATVIVPVEKVPSTGLRRVAARELVEDVFQLLGSPGREVELDWRERHREIGERLTGGGVLGIAEVVKELHDLSQIRPAPPKEREQYDAARHLLVHEVAVSMEVPPALAEDYLDYALTPPAGIKLPLKRAPKPKPARWVPRTPLPRHPAEKPEEVGRGAAKGGRAPEIRPKKRGPTRRGAGKARSTRRPVGKKRPAKRTSRAGRRR